MNTYLLAFASTVTLIATAPQSHAVNVLTQDFESYPVGQLVGNGVVQPTQGYKNYGFGEKFLYTGALSTDAPLALSAAGLPAHNSLTLSFSFAAIDSWDGSTTDGGLVPPDYLNVRINGNSVFSQTFDNFIPSDGSYTGAPLVSGFDIYTVPSTTWPDSGYEITLTVPHDQSQLLVEWYANGGGWQAGNDESFAIDNVKVSVNGVPDGGSTLALLGLGLAGLARIRRQV